MAKKRRELVSSWVVRESIDPITPEPNYTYEGPVRSPRDIIPYLARWAPEPVECVLLLALDPKLRILGHHVVARGSQSSCAVDPREILRAALLSGCAAFILAHNHPSGDVTPSQEDVAMTQRITQACAVVGVPMLDHLVIGVGAQGGVAHCSMKELGLMQPA